jgi:hypothetical protein
MISPTCLFNERGLVNCFGSFTQWGWTEAYAVVYKLSSFYIGTHAYLQVVLDHCYLAEECDIVIVIMD